MKIFNKLFLFLLLFGAVSCTYEPPSYIVDPESGSADFSTYVAMGASITAGYMDGAMYDKAQQNSYPNIIASQLSAYASLNGGTFNQPDIDSPIGYFGTASGIPGVPDGTPLGHLKLYYPNNNPASSPTPGPIIPGDPFNSTCTCPDVNNFGVPGARVVDAGFPGYGTLNPYFGRFAADPATSTMIGDALSASPTFFTFFLGGNDVLGYATGGASGSADGDGSNPDDMTSTAVFTSAFNGALAAMMSGGATGVVGNIPDVLKLPYFTTVAYNSIPMDAPTATGTNQAFTDYNNGLLAALGNGIIDQTEADFRNITFEAGNNGIVVFDPELTDVNTASGGAIPIPQIRRATTSDLITLTAGSVLGTLADPGDPTSVIGVGVPLNPNYFLTSMEQDVITTRISEYNGVIASAVSGTAGVELVDLDASFDLLFAGDEINSVGIFATVAPPFGAFSLDGIHPNGRGSAYLANIWIRGINEAFDSTIPTVNENDYPGNELPGFR